MAEKKESKIAEVKFDPKKATAEQIAKGLELLGKTETRKKRIEAGEIKGSYGNWAEMSPERKKKALDYSKKLRVRQQLILRKAAASGISVSDKEVDAELKSQA
jgi:hypothetical protein